MKGPGTTKKDHQINPSKAGAASVFKIVNKI
jgi:hypothetical protein